MKTAIRYILFVFSPLLFIAFFASHAFVGIQAINLNCFKIGSLSYDLSLMFGKNETFICISLMSILSCVQFANIKLEKIKYLKTQICLYVLSILMCFVVCSDNLFSFFVGIESLGLISALMVGQNPSSYLASTRVFIFNELASILFLLSIVMLGEHTKSFDFQSIKIFFEWTENERILALPATFLLISCLCKGAQFPLSKWLIDATVADTYISILLHSATVVWTGVIFIYKCYFIFERVEFLGEALIFVGGTTSLTMACCALLQTDVKKIIACSTSAAVGVAFVACGIKAYDVSIIYFICHAFSKSVFFLSVAYLMHIVSKESNILRMGGVSKIAPNVNDIVCVSFISIIGFPCFVSFFAKAPLLQVIVAYNKVALVVIISNILLMIAFWRLIYFTMYGNSRMDERTTSRVSDLQGSYMIPPWLLIVFSIFGSFASVGMYNIEINYAKESLWEAMQIITAVSMVTLIKPRYKKLVPAKMEQTLKNHELSEYIFSFWHACLLNTQKLFFIIDQKLEDYVCKTLQYSTEFLATKVRRLYKGSVEGQAYWLLLGIAAGITCAVVRLVIH